MMREECWKDIEGYEGFYQVSNFGNIRSKYSGKWKLMKATKTNHSRMIVGICNASIRKYSSYGDYSWEIIE